MEFKGTKGEWGAVFLDDTFIESTTGDTVCLMKDNGLYPNHVENAKLIASAPELLEALQMVTTQFEDLLHSLYGQNIDVIGWHKNGETQSFDSFIDDNDDGGLEKAQQAINKALK